MMCKTAIACGLCILSTMPAFAQVPGLGIKGGVDLATQRNVREGEADSLKTLTGIAAGVFATLPIASWLQVQPEVLYSRKGARADFEGIASQLQIDYLEVPVLARVSRRGSGALGYYAAGGPSIAFQLRARTRTNFGAATEEIDIGEQIERLDFGVAIGGGVEMHSFVIDGRYTHGLQDIDKDKSDGLKVANRAVTITFGYRF